MTVEFDLFGITHKQQPINQKRKGNVNESRLTHVLFEWTGYEFVRVPQSGGIRWKNRMNVCGDVISTDPAFDFPFSIETKHVACLGLRDGALRSNSVVFRYFDQCQRDADAAQKLPVLMLRENGMAKDTYYVFLKVSFIQMRQFQELVPIRFTESAVFAERIIGMDSKILLEKIDYQTFKSIYHGRTA